MTDPIKVFGNVGSPYTQKILSLLRYRNIPYSVSWGDVVQNLSFFNIEPPKPVLLPQLYLKIIRDLMFVGLIQHQLYDILKNCIMKNL